MSAADLSLPGAPGHLARRARLLAVLGLVFNAFTFGVSWWPFRQLSAQGLHPLWLTGLSYALVVLLLVAARPQSLAVLWRTPSLWWLMAAAGFTNACFNWAVTTGDVVRVVLLFYLMPLWAVLLARVLLGERISRRGGLRLALALVGALVVLWPVAAPGSSALGWPLPRNWAEALGLAGGLGFALNNVLLRREAAHGESVCALAMFLGGSAVALVLAGLLTHAGLATAPPPIAPLWAFAALGMGLWFLVANLALQKGAALLPANTTSVILITELLFAGLSALALGAGVLGPREAVGSVMILGAALMAAVQPD